MLQITIAFILGILLGLVIAFLIFSAKIIGKLHIKTDLNDKELYLEVNNEKALDGKRYAIFTISHH